MIRELVNNYCMEHGIYNGSFIDLIVDLMERVDDCEGDTYEVVTEAMDEGLIYTEDEWTVLHEYCSPTEANWEYAESEFTNLLVNVLEYIRENIEEDEEDEYDEEDEE